MSWSTALSVGGSLAGGALGSSDAKDAANDMKDIAREANDLQMLARNEAKYDLRPFLDSGTNANALLSEYLGISNPKGYAPKPTRDQVANEFSHRHYLKYGRGYSAKDSDMAGENNRIDAEYQKRLAEWEKGFEQYKLDNPEDGTGGENFGSLLKQFTNEDFVKDPGYNFQLAEGEKGIDRALAARGGRESGAALKAIAKYNVDFAGTKFNEAYNRDSLDKNRIYGFLSNTAGAGQNAAATKAGINQSSINQQNQNSLNSANQIAGLNIQSGNMLNQGIQSAVGNYIYGTERAKNSSIFGSPTYTPSNGGSSSLPSPWYK